MLVCLALSAGSPRRCIDARGRKGPCGPGNSDCDAQHPRSPAAAFHVFDLSCGENDPNAPVYDARHGVYHLFYQDHVGLNGSGITFGHAVSRDMVRWARMPVALWNGLDVPTGRRTAYDAHAIYSGSAAADPEGMGLTLVYPGVCDKGSSPQCTTGTTVNLAQPADRRDPLATNFSKLDVNPIAQVDGAVGPGGGGPPGGGGDSSAPWKTSTGQWRFITRDNVSSNVWESDAFFAKGSWRNLGAQPGFTQGACPSFFPLPGGGNGTHVYLYSKTTLPAPDTHRSVMVVGTYTEHGKGKLGTFKGRPYQIVDNGSYYAAKDFLDPVKERRILWGWAQIPGGANALPREVRWDAALGRLLFPPIDELSQLRVQPAIADLRGASVSPGAALALVPPNGGGADQSEILVDFALPKVAATFGVELLAPRGGTLLVVSVDFAPGRSRAVVGIQGGAGKDYGQTEIPIAAGEKSFELRLFVDNVIAEAFFLGGRAALTAPFAAPGGARADAFSTGARVGVHRAQAWRMGSIYVRPEQVAAARRLPVA